MMIIYYVRKNRVIDSAGEKVTVESNFSFQFYKYLTNFQPIDFGVILR